MGGENEEERITYGPVECASRSTFGATSFGATSCSPVVVVVSNTRTVI